jgi:hypothetical protein
VCARARALARYMRVMGRNGKTKDTGFRL